MRASLARTTANEAQVPAGKVIPAIVDNYVTHKRSSASDGPPTPLDLTLHANFGILAQRRRRLLRRLTKRRLKRGIFLSVVELQAAIIVFALEHNEPSISYTIFRALSGLTASSKVEGATDE
jgi:hypothetical protein